MLHCPFERLAFVSIISKLYSTTLSTLSKLCFISIVSRSYYISFSTPFFYYSRLIIVFLVLQLHSWRCWGWQASRGSGDQLDKYVQVDLLTLAQSCPACYKISCRSKFTVCNRRQLFSSAQAGKQHLCTDLCYNLPLGALE